MATWIIVLAMQGVLGAESLRGLAFSEWGVDWGVGTAWLLLPDLDCSQTANPAEAVLLVDEILCAEERIVERAASAKAVIVVKAEQSRYSRDVLSQMPVPVGFVSGEQGSLLVQMGYPLFLRSSLSGVTAEKPSLSLMLSLDAALDAELAPILPLLISIEDQVPISVRYDDSLFDSVHHCREAGDNCQKYAEFLRQTCIIRLHGAAGFLSYLETWLSECTADVSQKCTADSSALFSAADIDTCVASLQPSDTFDSELRTGTHTAPGLLLSHQRYIGRFDPASVQQAICSEFHNSFPFCTECAPGCPHSLLLNSQCDPACNTSDCDFDHHACESPRFLDGGHSQCADGCTRDMLRDNHCHPSCNNLSCDYNNWRCRCAADCPPGLLINDVCDDGCNNRECDNDNKICLKSPPAPPPAPSEVPEDTTTTMSHNVSMNSSSSKMGLIIGVSVACGGVCCL